MDKAELVLAVAAAMKIAKESGYNWENIVEAARQVIDEGEG